MSFIFTSHKITHFQKPISALADEPALSASALKAYFDASPEELRSAHNNLIDDLADDSAASLLGFASSAGVPADNVQDAIDKVQRQIATVSSSGIASGSIDESKLSDSVIAQFTTLYNRTSALDNRIDVEATQRSTADTRLQTNIDAKCSLVHGIYTGDGQSIRSIALGCKPKAILVISGSNVTTSGSLVFFATPERPSMYGEHPLLTLSNSTITVYYTESLASSNNAGFTYPYLAFC